MNQKQIVLYFFIFLNVGTCFSQNYINRDKAYAKKWFSKYVEKNNVKTIIHENDSSLQFLIRDSTIQNLDFILKFDKNGKCESEQYILTCDSCYRKFLNATLKNPFSRWTQIDSNTYLARFPYRVILTAKLENMYSFLMERSKMEGKIYRKMVRESLD